MELTSGPESQAPGVSGEQGWANPAHQEWRRADLWDAFFTSYQGASEPKPSPEGQLRAQHQSTGKWGGLEKNSTRPGEA